jgi:hypothetical protein
VPFGVEIAAGGTGFSGVRSVSPLIGRTRSPVLRRIGGMKRRLLVGLWQESATASQTPGRGGARSRS